MSSISLTASVLATVCAYILVQSGDSCGSLASKCGISAADFTKYNPSSTLCSTLTPGEPVCCSAGSLPDLSPQPNANGTCYSYTVQVGDYCQELAQKYYITSDEIETYNAQTWAWMGCNDLQKDAVICLSSGHPPMPAPLQNAVCGPQVPGTEYPSQWSDISNLNPCPLNACCDIWGQCGITPDFCTPSNSTTGAPGTAASGSNGCISNCGTSIVKDAAAPSEFMNIGYFEAFNVNRSCLVMDASQLPSAYSHIHFAFGGISEDYQVTLGDSMDQFQKFVANSTGAFKRILSFGGWSFSTDLDSYPIFRQGVTDANRLTFAQNVVSVVNQYGLDGVDFDWEYPDAPDIPGIPPGSPSDGPNYLSFLQTLRSLLPPGKSISIAAPASYWYLKGFPIANMSEVLDYIVYMTYDLHGQWDYNNSFSNPGCPTGNCLRSHINLTETEYALSMITKAGVPANKIVVGIAGYGRSFGMVDPACTGPECLFTGPESTASPGRCTQTAGYISQAELGQFTDTNTIISRSDSPVVSSWHDNSSDSDMMVYANNTWVAYMSQDTKVSRINRYASYGFAGTVEWALDLVDFVKNATQVEQELNITALENYFTAGLNISGYNTSDFLTYNLTNLATRLVGWDGCEKEYGMDPAQIFSGWQESWKLMNYIYGVAKGGINFNEAAAVEYLAPPALNKDQQTEFKNIFLQLATIQPGYIETPLDWRIAVRCDDPARKCLCKPNSKVTAYTTNKDDEYDIARINFCPLYFTSSTLDRAMEYAQPSLGVDWYADLGKYTPNQAATWIHELLHIDWVSLAGDYGSNEHVTDLKIAFKIQSEDPDKPEIWEVHKAYTPRWCKSLARWGTDTGKWVIRNADSMTQYIMAKYVQNALGDIYPHLPLGGDPPGRVNLFTLPDLFSMPPNGTVEILNSTNFDDPSVLVGQGACAADDDEDGDSDPSNTLTLSAGFAVQSDYPADYLSSYSSWAGLTPTTTTSSATPTPTCDDTCKLNNGNPCTCTEDGCDDNSPSCCASGTCPSCDCNEDGCSTDSPACCGNDSCAWSWTGGGGGFNGTNPGSSNAPVYGPIRGVSQVPKGPKNASGIVYDIWYIQGTLIDNDNANITSNKTHPLSLNSTRAGVNGVNNLTLLGFKNRVHDICVSWNQSEWDLPLNISGNVPVLPKIGPRYEGIQAYGDRCGFRSTAAASHSKYGEIPVDKEIGILWCERYVPARCYQGNYTAVVSCAGGAKATEAMVCVW